MPRKCCVYGCSTGYASNKNKISMYRFPLNGEALDAWIKAVPNNFTAADITRNMTVCRKHWPAEMESKRIAGGHFVPLNPPSVFDCYPPHDTKNSSSNNLKLTKLSTVQRESEHTCAVCDLPFATALQLKNHMSTVHPLARPYKCTLCTKTFQTPATLRNHFETHSTEKPWQCSLCHKSFPKKYYLMTHVKSMHQRVRKYECSLCKQGLRHLGEYKAHMLRHAGTKPFQCDQCDKCYYQKGGLLTHMLTHSGETPFTCWVCLKGFRRKADCMRHVERSHSPTSANKMRMEDASASVEQEEATDFTISEEIKMEPVEEVETVDEKPQSDFDSLLEHLASEIGD